MDEDISMFLGVTGSSDEAVARQYLEMTSGDLEYAVTLFMESQPGAAPTTSSGPPGGDDAELARKLQEEAYEVREADALVHRHDTLVDDGFGGPMPMGGMFSGAHGGIRDMFGSIRVGVFNQRFDDAENEFYAQRNRFEELADDDDDSDVIVVSDDDEPPLTLTQARLALLFRPPFDLITIALVDEARQMGKRDHKWILVNIQDVAVFQLQVMNRDFWSQPLVKLVVKENFVFLQYQEDSPNGSQYVNFYHIDECPHLAILDPWTGERLHKWTDGEVPDVDQWLEDVELFLERFSLAPGSQNPVVTHDRKIDPDSLTEEQQIELAMKQSMAGALPAPETPAPVAQDPFEAIDAAAHDEPADGVRMQIRFPNGKRLVHKFGLNEPVRAIFGWLKHEVAGDGYGIGADEKFTLTNPTNRGAVFMDHLDDTVEQMGLKNASLLVEKE